MNLTDQEIETLVSEVSNDVTGGYIERGGRLMDDKTLTDNIHYPDDPKKQFVLETLVMGASMQDAFDHLSEAEALLRGKILLQFLRKLGITFQ